MRSIRAIINAMLVATLVKPMVKRALARTRRRAAQYAEATIVIPAQGLLEAVLPADLAPVDASPEGPSDETIEELVERHALRTVLLAGAVALVIVAAVLAIAAVVRRRRAAAASEREAAAGLVAVPVGPPTEEAEAAVGMGTSV